MKAMVLAAGKATRLRPVTDAIAKPALSFAGRAILDRVLDGLADAGVTEAVVNLHHAPGSVRALVERRGDALPVVTFSDETQLLLGTGGALVPVQATFASEDPFLLVNGDCVHSLDYGALLRTHRETGADATLAVRPRGERGFGALRANERGEITAWSVPSEGRADERHFLSAQVLSPRLFRFLPRGGGSFGSFTDWYPRAQDAGCLFVAHPTEAEWHALDSLDLYLAACRDWLARRCLDAWIDPRARVRGEVASSLVHAGAVVEAHAKVSASALLEGARVESGAIVEDCLVGPLAVVRAGESVSGRLIA